MSPSPQLMLDTSACGRIHGERSLFMDLSSLRALLISEGFRPDAYDLGEPGWRPSETYALREREGGWVTFYAERRHENSLRAFTTFAEAAADLIGRLRADHSTHRIAICRTARDQGGQRTPGMTRLALCRDARR